MSIANLVHLMNGGPWSNPLLLNIPARVYASAIAFLIFPPVRAIRCSRCTTFICSIYLQLATNAQAERGRLRAMGIPKSQAPKIHLSIRLHRLWRLWSSEVGRDDDVRRPVDDNLVPTAGYTHTHTPKQGGRNWRRQKAESKAKRKENRYNAAKLCTWW